MEPSKPTGLEVNVVQWQDGRREVAINFKDFNQLITLDAEGAKHLAFMLMECADFLQPPFSEDTEESIAIFGSYEPEEDEDGEEEEDASI